MGALLDAGLPVDTRGGSFGRADALLQQRDRLGGAGLPRLRSLGLAHPARVLLAVRVRQALVCAGGVRCLRERPRELLRYLDLARRIVPRDADAHPIAGPHAERLPLIAAQTDPRG